jgi:hypothetical protein
MTAKLAGLAPIPDHPGHLGGKLGIGQQQINERAEHLLSGNPGESEPVGGFSLPDVEGAVCGGGQVDGPSRPLPARTLAEVLMDTGETLG